MGIKSSKLFGKKGNESEVQQYTEPKDDKKVDLAELLVDIAEMTRENYSKIASFQQKLADVESFSPYKVFSEIYSVYSKINAMHNNAGGERNILIDDCIILIIDMIERLGGTIIGIEGTAYFDPYIHRGYDIPVGALVDVVQYGLKYKDTLIESAFVELHKDEDEIEIIAEEPKQETAFVETEAKSDDVPYELPGDEIYTGNTNPIPQSDSESISSENNTDCIDKQNNSSEEE